MVDAIFTVMKDGAHRISTRRFQKHDAECWRIVEGGGVVMVMSWDEPRAVIISPERYRQLLECERSKVAATEDARPAD